MFSALLTRTKYIGTGTPTPPGPDYSVPLTIEVSEKCDIFIYNPQKGMKLKINGRKKIPVAKKSYAMTSGDKVQLFGDYDKISNYGGTNIIADGSHIIYGNIMSLVDEFGYTSATSIPSEQCFAGLFKQDSKLLSAKDLLLPATVLATECYREMFAACDSLKYAPVLPATSLAPACYKIMFIDCTHLKYIKCLATSGINVDSSTESWMKNAGIDESGTKVFTAATGSVWPTNDNNGIPDGWTRENV